MNRRHVLHVLTVCWATAALGNMSMLTRDSSATIRIRIVDDVGAPVAGARVEVGCINENVDEEHLSNTNGMVVYRRAIGKDVYCNVQKDGYYMTSGRLRSGYFRDKSALTNDFAVSLKRVMNRVEMITGDFHRWLPPSGGPVGFDLFASDFVQPHGRGTHCDFIVKVGIDMPNPNTFTMDASMVMTFTNRCDGIQLFSAPQYIRYRMGSVFPPPQIAPETGYRPDLNLNFRVRAGDEGWIVSNSYDKATGFLFRVRSVVDAEGRIVSAHYGWIDGEIEYFEGRNGRPMPMLRLRYYCNPDPHSRGLEPK